MLSRRKLFKLGAVSGVTLLTIETFHASLEIPPAPEGLGHSFEFLTPVDRGILSKITPVILAEALPESNEERVLAIKEVIPKIELMVRYNLPSLKRPLEL